MLTTILIVLAIAALAIWIIRTAGIPPFAQSVGIGVILVFTVLYLITEVIG